jgi:hypothetical protein
MLVRCQALSDMSPVAPVEVPGRCPGGYAGKDQTTVVSRVLSARNGPATIGEGDPQLPARANAELVEHFAKMPFDGPRANEELRADFGVRQAVASKAGDLGFLCGEVLTCLDIPFVHIGACSQQLPLRATGEALHAHRAEQFISEVQFAAGVDPAILTSKPFAV